MNPVLTKEEVSELLQCSVYTVEERARKGDLPGLKFGQSWIFPSTALFRHLDGIALDEAEKRRAPPIVKPSRGILRNVPKSSDAKLYESMAKLGLAPVSPAA